jgi:hypothetical protein
MELTFQGIPCIVAGNPIYNALDLNFTKDKKQYFHMIKQSHKIEVSDRQKIDVAIYLYLLKKKHVHVGCISYDWKLKKFYWNRKSLMKYLKNGDESINAIVEDMLI